MHGFAKLCGAVCRVRWPGARCVAAGRRRDAAGSGRERYSSTFALEIERNTGGLSCLNYIWRNIMRNK